MKDTDAPGVTADLLEFFNRLFDPSQAPDVLNGPEFDESLLHLAEKAILAHIGSRALTPAFLAEQLGVSRASLYRVFAPIGGVMRHVAEQRLIAVRGMLSDPLEHRSLTKLSEDYGFSSPSVFSRAFHTRFGMSPRAWGHGQTNHHEATADISSLTVGGFGWVRRNLTTKRCLEPETGV